MPRSRAIVSHLPFLRRYAQALTGSQKSGDAYVRATLEAMIAAPETVPEESPSRVPFYRLFHAIWSSTALPEARGEPVDLNNGCGVAARLRALPPERREALLLTSLEGFSFEEAGAILGREPSKVRRSVDAAMADIARGISTEVLIVEDELLIARDLAGIVKEMGHKVLAVAPTHKEAVSAARKRRPGLILADIHLADDSSGLDAVREIRACGSVPVIFITAFPERVLIDEKPEPTLMISKPFPAESLKAAISQALFFHAA
jgi:CheY-like chemotaxis protein/DNA-directed RNA polymerase specialized sigma24 family protein